MTVGAPMGDASTRGKRNRNHGHETERMVCRYLREQGWPDACSTRSKLGTDGTRTPGDVDWHPLIVLETKSVARSAWPTWCRQAAAEAPPGTIPVVLRRTRGVTDVGAWECRVMDRGTLDLHRTNGGVIAGSFVDGVMWRHSAFADLVAAVRQLDTEGAA